jgi:uncharacterized protein
MERGLVFGLLEIPQGGALFEARLPAEELGLEMADLRLAEPLHIRLDMHRSGDSIRVQGRFTDRLTFTCGRCLGLGEEELSGDFDIFCERRDGELSEEDRQALEEGGLVFHDGRSLDLFEEIRQSVALEIPWHPVCRPDCRGLCPRCGHDLNQGDCDCAREQDSRWAPLKNLLR